MDIGKDLQRAYDDGYEQGKQDAVKWIPVTERLPEEQGENYLVAMTTPKGIEVHEAVFFKPFDDYEWLDPVEEYQKYDVTHWMPLPEPPKDGET